MSTLTISFSGIFMGFPVLNDVKIPFLVIGAEGSAPSFSFRFFPCEAEKYYSK